MSKSKSWGLLRGGRKARSGAKADDRKPWDHFFERARSDARASGTDTNDELEKVWAHSLVWHDTYIAPHIEPGMAVLEIGPGSGRQSQHVFPDAGHYYFCDYSTRALEILKEEFGEEKASYLCPEDCRLEGIPDGVVDFAFAIGVFVHLTIEQAYRYIHELSRVMKDGGKAFIHFADLGDDLSWWVEHIPEKVDTQTAIFRPHHPDQFASIARHADLKVVDRSEIPDTRHRFVVLQK